MHPSLSSDRHTMENASQIIQQMHEIMRHGQGGVIVVAIIPAANAPQLAAPPPPVTPPVEPPKDDAAQRQNSLDLFLAKLLQDA